MKKFITTTSILTLVTILAACNNQATDTSVSNEVTQVEQSTKDSSDIIVSKADLAGNPFIGEWETPYGVPPFTKISDDHFMPAIKAGILDLREEIDTIVNNSEAPSFRNTIVALDMVGEELGKVSGTFGNITGTDTNDTLKALEGEIWPLLTREFNKIQSVSYTHLTLPTTPYV